MELKMACKDMLLLPYVICGIDVSRSGAWKCKGGITAESMEKNKKDAFHDVA